MSRLERGARSLEEELDTAQALAGSLASKLSDAASRADAMEGALAAERSALAAERCSVAEAAAESARLREASRDAQVMTLPTLSLPSASPFPQPRPLPQLNSWVIPCLGGVPREQKMLKGHLPRVIYHQVY